MTTELSFPGSHFTSVVGGFVPDLPPASADERTCAACHETFDTFGEVFSHDCPADRPVRSDSRLDRFEAAVAASISARPENFGRDDVRRAGRSTAYHSAPALMTERQAAYLTSLGVSTFDIATTTKLEASKMIDDAKNAPRPAAAPSANVRPNRYDANCRVCGSNVPAGSGSLLSVSGRWVVEHVGGCPAKTETATSGYEPVKGDVHVIDGVYFRIHVSQTSGYPYVAVWNDGADKFLGPREDDRAKGMLRKLSTETLATADEAAAFGHMTERCCFCSTPIDTPESEAVGYGPKCASDRGLPWGNVTA